MFRVGLVCLLVLGVEDELDLNGAGMVSALRQSGLSIRDTFYAYSRGDTMQIADFRRFVENQGLRLTREEVDDLVRATRVGAKNGALSYFEFRQIFAQAEKSGSEGGWGRLSLHLRRKLAAQREFLEGAFRAADTNARGMLNRAQIRRVLSSHVLPLSPSEIEQAISGY